MVAWFWVCFVSTVVALLAATHAGRTGRRRRHFWLVGVTVVLLGATIVLTEALTRALDLPERELGIHLFFAKGATVVLLVTLATGFGYALRGGPRWRHAHRVAVVATFLAIVAATATGIWVVSLAP